MASVDVPETYIHIALVDFPTSPIAAIAAMNIMARINPYSMAVAALVARISLFKKRIVPPLCLKL